MSPGRYARCGAGRGPCDDRRLLGIENRADGLQGRQIAGAVFAGPLGIGRQLDAGGKREGHRLVGATFKGGLLTLQVPKNQASKAREIPVKTG